MKSFGVRFAAGAITILFGAYAAALAQKDKQDSSTSWTAKAPSLGEPAVPIAENGEQLWLTQPAASLDKAAAQLAGSFESAEPVQLVQHTETVEGEANDPSFDASALPDSLGVETGQETSAGAVADWTLPSSQENDSVAASGGGPAVAMTLPAGNDGGGEQVDEAASSFNQLPQMQLGVAPEMEFQPESPEQGEQYQVQPYSADPMAEASNPSTQDDASGFDYAAQAAQGPTDEGQPSNTLRGTDSSANSLRGPGSAPSVNMAQLAESTFPGTDNTPSAPTTAPADYGAQTFEYAGAPPNDAVGMAQNAPGFGLSAQQFNQGAPQVADTSQAGLGSPQFGGYPQSGGSDPAMATTPGMNAQQGFNGAPQNFNSPQGFANAPQGFNNTPQGIESAPPPRMASLPRTPNTVPGYPTGYEPQMLEQPMAAAAIDPNSTIDSPGDRRLEGVQTPSVIIQKRAPTEVKVGKPASFVIHVQNVGTVEALDVQVHDRVPAGMRLVDASPAPVQQGNLLLWQLGAMPAGEERTVTMQLIPEQEGELGSVARVSFEAAASVRTISTRPELKIVQTAPETVLIGQQLEIELEVSNPGSGEATGVVLQEDVPEGLEHPKGRQLDNGLGTLAAGEVRNQVLRLRAVAPGIVQNTIRLTGDDGLTAEHTVAVQVVAPDLQVELSGPSRRFLERQATYQLNIANAGTADATNVEIAVQLDRGFTFVSTDYEGQYDPSRHSVYWSLAQLPAGGRGAVPLTLLPVEEGEQAIVIDARADLGVIAKSERRMTVEGFSELSFEIKNQGGPIELGSETNYEIRINNSGSKADTNVRVQIQVPPGLELVALDGEADTDGRGLIAFQPKSKLSAGEEMKYSLRLRGVAPGTHLVRAVVVSDQSTVPVTKEESTLVYADQ